MVLVLADELDLAGRRPVGHGLDRHRDVYAVPRLDHERVLLRHRRAQAYTKKVVDRGTWNREGEGLDGWVAVLPPFWRGATIAQRAGQGHTHCPSTAAA